MTRHCNAFLAIPLMLAGLAGGAGAETRVGGDITGQVRWTKAQSPFIVIQDVVVTREATLTIDPGVVVRFKPNLADQRGLRPFDLEIAVYGTLLANGVDGDSVFFTSDAVEPSWQDWAGIIIPEAAGKAVVSRAVIEFCSNGISVVGGDIEMSRTSIRYCSEKGISIIRGRARLTKNYITGVGNFAGSGRGIFLMQSPDVLVEGNFVVGVQSGMAIERGSNARVVNNLFSLNKLYGITVTNSSPEIVGNNITQNDFGLFLRGGSVARVKDNNIFENALLDLKLADYRMGADRKPLEVDLSGNWWGRYTPDVVYDKIEDSDDIPAIGARAQIEPVRKDAFRAE